ncbi:MAG: glycosyltransferase family 2 protein [Thermoplasmatales archaeon]|nr:MAG: glycosyltransferase family 2 protein [Thermoplasmatales archaeon]
MHLQILIILGIIGILGECYLICLWIFARQKKKKEIPHPYSPSACVIVPCKGFGKGITENLNAFCSQQYPTYQLIFVVDSKKDPIYQHLEQITEKYPHATIRITKSKRSCSGKIAALLTGLESIKPVEVLVFADCDIKPNATWLKNLIAPLHDVTIGASTGYRWYFPTNLKTQLISAWNMATIAFMFYPRYTFAWGGSTAIRKSVFNKLEIKSKWQTAFSDDLVVTTTLKKAGYSIYFQPKCIMESPTETQEETSIKQFMRWGTRQYTWVRWYYPIFWYGSFIGFVGIKLFTILGICLLIIGYYFPGLLMVSTIFLEIIYGWQGITTFQKTMVYPQQRFSSKIKYALMTPIAFFMIAQNVLASSIKREIPWAGRTYKKPKHQD